MRPEIQETAQQRRLRLAKLRQDRWVARHPLGRRQASKRWKINNPGYRNPKSVATSRLVADLKAEPCTDCSKRFPEECMDFDHVRGIKLHNVGELSPHPNQEKSAQ